MTYVADFGPATAVRITGARISAYAFALSPMNFVRLACLSSLAALCAPALAAPVCFRATLAVPATTEGLYVNLVTGVSGANEASVPGFDIDLYAVANTEPSGQLRFYWGPMSTGGAGVAVTGDVYARLGDDVVIGPESIFTRAAFAGDTSAWQANVTGFLGLRFRDEANGNIRYGWLELMTSAPIGFPANILGWCYEDTGGPISTPGGDTLFKTGFEG